MLAIPRKLHYRIPIYRVSKIYVVIPKITLSYQITVLILIWDFQKGFFILYKAIQTFDVLATQIQSRFFILGESCECVYKQNSAFFDIFLANKFSSQDQLQSRSWKYSHTGRIKQNSRRKELFTLEGVDIIWTKNLGQYVLNNRRCCFVCFQEK